MQSNISIITPYSRYNIFMFYFIFLIYKAIGLAPLTINISTIIRKNERQMILNGTHSTTGLVYNIGLAVSLLLTTFIVLQMSRDIDIIGGVLLEFEFEMLFLICGNSFFATLLLIYCFNQKILVTFTNRLEELETELIRKLPDYHFDTKYCRIISIHVVYLLLNIMVLVMEIIDRFGNSSMYFVITVVPGFVLGSSLIQYAILLTLLESKFHGINGLLLLLTNGRSRNGYQDQSMCFDSIFLDIYFIRKVQRLLYEITSYMSNFFLWPVLLVISFFFAELIYCLYYFLTPFILPQTSSSLIDNIDCALWIMRDSFPIIILTICVNRILAERRVTIANVYKVMATYSTGMETIKYELAQFSTELLDNTLSFTACELFTLDGSLLTSIAGAMLTYLIILLQYEHDALSHTDKYSTAEPTSFHQKKI